MHAQKKQDVRGQSSHHGWCQSTQWEQKSSVKRTNWGWLEILVGINACVTFREISEFFGGTKLSKNVRAGSSTGQAINGFKSDNRVLSKSCVRPSLAFFFRGLRRKEPIFSGEVISDFFFNSSDMYEQNSRSIRQYFDPRVTTGFSQHLASELLFGFFFRGRWRKNSVFSGDVKKKLRTYCPVKTVF